MIMLRSVSETRLIKKYPNRRLYDTKLSRYITLHDIRALIVGQAEVRVTEQRTGHDITREVLLQVVAEQEKTEHARLSQPFLAQLIGSYASTAAEPTSRYLEESMATYMDDQQHTGESP
jgi:polyhydroxyalkanoate synthesis repressor PhaR